MKFIHRVLKRGHNKPSQEKVLLFHEIRRAHWDWVSAQARLDWVIEKEEIDYAIVALDAAEKRYGMLLRQAKRMTWTQEEHPVCMEG